MTTAKLIEKYRNPETLEEIYVRYVYDRTSKGHSVVSGSETRGWDVKRFASIYMAEAELERRREMAKGLGFIERVK